ncbi:hypothetical protein SUGI_0377160 [Cryptomeria japonica]|nr:hypothetical protein SUGI_0377160 [Cryptomeria japonica]
MMLLPLLLFFSALPALIAESSNYSDREALIGFKAALSFDPFNSLLDWSLGHIFCNWTGVTCSPPPQRVVSLNLTGMGLFGPISPLLGNLSFLTVLDLYNNSFQGHIPYQIGNLFRLTALRLSRNNLEGPIPSSLGGCRSLRFLRLSLNNLSGSIPSEFSLLSNLETMSIAVNQLTGVLPPFMGNLSSLTIIELGENRFEGSIPVELGMLTQLNWLNVHTNNLIGSIPVALSNCSHLQMLQLYQNNLTGPIPWELGRLSELQYVYLWGNQLAGEIPTSLGNWTQLQVLYLERNKLSGTVPLVFGKMKQLRRFILWQNHFVSGGSDLPILTDLTNCSSLEQLDLGLNYLTGVLPNSVGHLSNSLSFLALNYNEIEGNIPDEIGNLTNLATVTLEANRFNGTIPSTLSKLSNLERIFLDKNNLEGRIPESLGQSKRLGLLSISENMLSGSIPESLGDLPQLRELDLHRNQLSGEIPASLGRCQTLERVDLAYNQLTENIPPEVAGLQNLHLYFNLSNNLLKGSILDVSKMVMVLAIDLSHNHFSSGIPSALASCTALEYLNLSWNAFEGPIPVSLATLKNLEDMDFSGNNLSGTIPVAFEDMKMLRHLNLSSNRLTGEVPKGGVFSDLGSSAVAGNLGLCGAWINLPPCPNFKSKHKGLSVSRKVIISVLISIVILVLCFVLLAFFYKWRCKRQSISTDKLDQGSSTESDSVDQSTLDLHVEPTRISYEELVSATHGFSEANLLGKGGFGSVYKGILNNGRNIAVKVLNFQDKNAHKSFTTECNTLKRVRHRNVIKIITVCSNPVLKALVLPFMSNGSLDRWLYPEGGDECKLNLNERLIIALGIAQGMEYLHHHCFVEVIHCDLKPSNVLMGDDINPYIGDFGIAKVVFGNSLDSLASTNALQGSFGYMAPEYAMGGKIGTTGDIYSYGILLLELLTRKKPTDTMFTEGLTLPKWVSINFPDKIAEVVDHTLLRNVNESDTSMVLVCLTQLLQVGLVCTNKSPLQRPSMKEVVMKLNDIKDGFLNLRNEPAK